MSLSGIFLAVCLLTSTHSESRDCNGDCACNGGEPCTLNCDNDHICNSRILTCPSQQPCNINCIGSSHSCEGAIINAQNSHDTILICDQYLSCNGLTIHCPINYDCTIFCSGTGTDVCQHIIINGSASSNVLVDCDQTAWKLCYSANVYCGKTCNILCNGTSSYEETCTNLYTDLTETNVFNLYCDDSCNSTSRIITSHPTTNPTDSPTDALIANEQTDNPTTDPTLDPTINTVAFSIEYGISIQISFQYKTLNSTSTNDLNAILSNITKQIIYKRIQNASLTDDCIQSVHYNVSVLNVTVSITATIFVCDKHSQSQLVAVINTQKLATDLVYNVNNEQILSVQHGTIYIEVDEIIRKGNKITTTYYMTDSTVNVVNKDKNNDNADINIMIVFLVIGCIILLCVVIIFVVICMKIKKVQYDEAVEHITNKLAVQLTPPHSAHIPNATDIFNEAEPGQNVQNDENEPGTMIINDIDRVKGRDRVESNESDYNVMNDINVTIGAPDIVSDQTDHDNTLNEMEGDDTTQNIEESDDDEKIITNKGMDENDIQNIGVKEWLENTVNLSEYYDNFICNGYESIAFIKSITNKTELIEIGIIVKKHQIRLMDEIKQLQNDNNVTKQ